MASEENRQAILDQLDLIEAEMRKIGFWGREKPENPGSPLEIGMECWLQWVFLPNAREAARTDTLPDKSRVGTLALRQYDYHGTVEEALNLVSLLNRFDDLVLKAAPTSRQRRKKRKT